MENQNVIDTENVTSDMQNIIDEELSKQEVKRRTRAIKASKRLFRSFDILLDFAQNACPYINSKNKDTITCEKDIVYDESQSDVCRFDIYKVPTDKPQPAVIIIHGGEFYLRSCRRV